MYLCICHALNEQAVDAAREAGAATAIGIYRHYGVKPKCGKCVRAMQAVAEGQSSRDIDTMPPTGCHAA